MGATVVHIEIPTYLQVIAVLNAWVIKPSYMLMCAFLLKRLWSYRRQPEIWWLWWGIAVFLAGESACAVNFLVFTMNSTAWEMIHNVGMAFAFGFVTMGLLEIIDRRLLFQFIEGKACALMRFCQSCPVQQGQKCRFSSLFVLTSIAGAFVCSIPLTKGYLLHPLSTTVFGHVYSNPHRWVYQLFENRFCPVIAIVLFVATAVSLLLRHSRTMQVERICFSFAVAFGAFGLLRFCNYRINWDYPIWFDFWEESTEWITIFGLAYGLYRFRSQLLDEPVTD